VRQIDSKFIDISLIEEKQLLLDGGISKFKLLVLTDLNYLATSFEVEGKESFEINHNTLKELIKEVSFVAGTNEARPTLTGVNFIFDGTNLHVQATDTFRLVSKRIELHNSGSNFNIIVPKKTLEDLLKILEDVSDSTKVFIDLTSIVFEVGNVIFKSRLIEGIFPDTSTIMPRSYILETLANREELIKRIEDASLLSAPGNEINQNIVLLNKTIDNEFSFTSVQGKKGESFSKLKLISATSYDKLELPINSRLFIDVLKALNCTNVDIKFEGHKKKFLCCEPGNIDKLYYLIMPVFFS
jgi:DNA polymerase-3 subunit beta